MNIGINGRFLLESYTGIGQYTFNLLKALSEIDKKNNYFIVVPRKIEKIFGKNFKICVLPEKRLLNAGLKKIFFEKFQLINFLKKQKVDLIHHFYPVPIKKEKIPQIITVHDAIPWIMPEYRQKIRSKVYQGMVKKSIKNANKIIAVSKETKKDIKKYLKVPERKIKVIYNAPSDIFFEKISPGILNKVKEKYGVTRPYLLYAGGFDKRKNVETLIKVFIEEIAPYYLVDLILIGEQIRSSQLYKSFSVLKKTVESDINKTQKGQIKGVGFVSEKELAAFYQGCLAFCHLSVKEGCNLPLLEAVASGAPVVTSNIPVHKEMLGNRALFCDPSDPKKIAKQIKRIIEDEDFRFKLKKKEVGFKTRYSWRKTAIEVKAVYESSK